ncbi:HEPN domain-containing protein [Lacibacter sp. H375]|uniref:HEPN domain-containing protein n=1 Tax=Lacibacter sp. H375 TaxID=3133424 RepID=UPI0030C1B0D2
MDENNTLHVKVIIPDLEGKEMLGVLIISSKQKVIEFSEHPYGRMSFDTIPIMFCYSPKQNFTLIQSIFSKSNGNKVSYIINELYDNIVDDLFDSKAYTSLNAEVTNMSNWIPPKLIDISHEKGGEKLISVSIGNEVSIEYFLSEEYFLKFLLRPHFSLKSGEVRFFEDVSMTVYAANPTSRNRLFAAYYSLLNFYTLFLTVVPNTKKLVFERGVQFVNLILSEVDFEESRFHVLLQYNEVENFSVVVQKYFSQREKFDQVVSLWETGLKSNNPEIIFLYLTQSIEVLHKYFYEDDVELRDRIKSEVDVEFGLQNNKRKEWTNMMRYFHFFSILESEGLKIDLPLEKKEFLSYLLDSRNYYTHYDEKSFVWTIFQLYEINKVVRIFMRALILVSLGIDTKKIQIVIKREFYHSLEMDISKNQFSMWFGKKM